MKKLWETPTYRAWSAIKQRCYNRNRPDYPEYGGRGIAVCDKWKCSFRNFKDDMGEKPEGKSIDRIDNNGNYEPRNCRWATKKQQARNVRSNTRLMAFGETKILVEWSEDIRCMVGYSCLRQRLRRGWMVEKAILSPVRWKI